MWFITNSNSDKIIYIKNSKTSIGRKGTDIELNGDDSLSRTHAHFILTGDSLDVQDGKSKYGTFLKNIDLKEDKLGDKPRTLKDGDCIRFGIFENEWIVHKLIQKTCISMLEPQKKEKLSDVLKSFGVQVSEKLDETCTHLTMPLNTDVSNKLLQALALCIPIVTPKFWVIFQESVVNNKPLPKYVDYMPKVKEENYVTPGTVTLAMNEQRKKLFAGKNFVFTSGSQMKLYQEVIQYAGGKVISLSQAKMTPKQLCAKNVIVVKAKETESQSQNQNVFNKINNALASVNRRVITELEIGCAVLHCSTERFCNPENSISSLIGTSYTPKLIITRSKNLALETDSVNLQDPVPVRTRGRPKKATITKVVETINLSSDEEVELPNKENVPSAKETQESSSNAPINEEAEVAPAPVPINDCCIPVTQDDLTKDDDNATNVPSQRTTRATRSTKGSVERSVISPKPPSSSGLFSFNNTSLNVSLNNRTQRKPSLEQQHVISPKPPSSMGLFSFNDTSLNASAEKNRTLRKRKNSENAEANEASTANKIATKSSVEPVAKRNKIHKIVEDSDENDNEIPPTRKRSAKNALGNDGLFAFSTSFAKKTRKDLNETAEVSKEETGFLPYQKSYKSPTKPPLTSTYVDSLEDSGVWLSKKMISVNLSDSSDVMKSEVLEPDCTVETQDIKPEEYVAMFNVVVKSSGFDSSSSVVSKRKQFVKKKNYKEQSSIVTMKIVKVEDTYEQLLDNF